MLTTISSLDADWKHVFPPEHPFWYQYQFIQGRNDFPPTKPKLPPSPSLERALERRKNNTKIVTHEEKKAILKEDARLIPHVWSKAVQHVLNDLSKQTLQPNMEKRLITMASHQDQTTVMLLLPMALQLSRGPSQWIRKTLWIAPTVEHANACHKYLELLTRMELTLSRDPKPKQAPDLTVASTIPLIHRITPASLAGPGLGSLSLPQINIFIIVASDFFGPHVTDELQKLRSWKPDLVMVEDAHFLQLASNPFLEMVECFGPNRHIQLLFSSVPFINYDTPILEDQKDQQLYYYSPAQDYKAQVRKTPQTEWISDSIESTHSTDQKDSSDKQRHQRMVDLINRALACQGRGIIWAGEKEQDHRSDRFMFSAAEIWATVRQLLRSDEAQSASMAKRSDVKTKEPSVYKSILMESASKALEMFQNGSVRILIVHSLKPIQLPHYDFLVAAHSIRNYNLLVRFMDPTLTSSHPTFVSHNIFSNNRDLFGAYLTNEHRDRLFLH